MIMAEFKPLPKKKQSKAQREKVEEIQTNWRKHPWVEDYHEEWKANIRFLEGDQYIWYDEKTKTIFDIEEHVDRDVKNVYNRVLPIIRQQWSDFRYPHEFYVIPNTSEAEDIKAARGGSMVIEFTNAKGKFHGKINMAKLWALITGVCFWKEWWNKDLYGLVKSKSGIGREKGDVDYNLVNPFNVRPDADGFVRGDWRYFDEGKRLPKSDVAQMFGVPEDQLPAVPKGDEGVGIFIPHNKSQSDEERTLVIERWVRPNKEYPKGRFYVIAGDWLLWEGDSPAPDAEIPYFQFPGIFPRLGHPISESAVRVLIHPQRQFNRYCSMVDEHIENFRVKGMIPWGSLQGEDLKGYRRAGVDYVQYHPKFGTPYMQSPPPIPETVVNWLNFMENELETESSVRKVSLGQLPKYATRASGVLYEGLRSRDKEVMYPAVDDQDEALQEAVKFRLKLIKKHYSVRRLIKTLGRNKRPIISEFKGTDLRDNTDVRVKSGVDIMTTRDKKQEVVIALVDKGFLQDPRKAMELLDVKDVDEYFEEEFIDQKQAERQIEIMKEKEIYIEADANDNHEVHYKIFNDFRKSEEFENLTPKVKGFIRQRIEAHKQYLGIKESEIEGEEAASPTAGERAAGTPPAAAPTEAAPALSTEQIMTALGGEGV